MLFRSKYTSYLNFNKWTYYGENYQNYGMCMLKLNLIFVMLFKIKNSYMERLTVLLAHSDFEKSIANKTIIEQLKGEFKDIDIRDLSKMYPNFNIDIEAEQNN